MDKMLILHVFASLQMCYQNQNFVNTLPHMVKSVKTATFDDVYEGIKLGSTMLFADCLFQSQEHVKEYPCADFLRIARRLN